LTITKVRESSYRHSREGSNWVANLLTVTKVRDARILHIVIPAKAGIHVATVKVKMGPRFRGDDNCGEAVTHFGIPQ
jgi:hypothetical protein